LALDLDLLSERRYYEDHKAGIVEEFVQPVLGGARTVGVLSRPLGPSHPLGWVMCHSFGLERLHLGRLDVLMARALSAAGFPVLRFDGQGYGDSERGMEAVGLTSHVSGVSDAVDLVAGLDGVRAVGLAGARFGGTVASMVATAKDVSSLILIEPIIRGAQFMREFVLSRVLSGLAGKGRDQADPAAIRQELAERGWTDVNGFLLTRDAYESISTLDLTRDVHAFSGRILLVGISRTGRAGVGLERLHRHLESLGASCVVEIVRDQSAAQFGQFNFRTIDGGRGKADTRLELDHTLARLAASWSLAQLDRSAARLR